MMSKNHIIDNCKNIKEIFLKKDYKSLFSGIRRLFYCTKHEKLLKEWFKCNGDVNLRLNHNLNKNSIVFDVGCYKGKFTKDIFDKFGCKVYSFEPINDFINCIDKSLFCNDKIKFYNFGLWNKTTKGMISVNDDESSVYNHRKQIEVLFVDIMTFLKKNGIKKIDLMEINIEGGEYDLLEHLIKNNWIKNIKNIQIQFHKNVKNYDNRRNSIQLEINKTHILTYNFPYIMENWKLK